MALDGEGKSELDLNHQLIGLCFLLALKYSFFVSGLPTKLQINRPARRFFCAFDLVRLFRRYPLSMFDLRFGMGIDVQIPTPSTP